MTAKNDRPADNAVPYTPVVSATGDLVFVSGQIGIANQDAGEDPSFEAEVERALAKVAKLLAERGFSLGDVCRVGVYLADRSTFTQMNDVYRRAFSPPFPARTTIEAGIIREGARIEIDAVASRRQVMVRSRVQSDL